MVEEVCGKVGFGFFLWVGLNLQPYTREGGGREGRCSYTFLQNLTIRCGHGISDLVVS